MNLYIRPKEYVGRWGDIKLGLALQGWGSRGRAQWGEVLGQKGVGAVSIYLLINLLFYLLINLYGWGGGGMGAGWGWLSRSGQGPLSLCHPQPLLPFLGPCSPPSPFPFPSDLLYGFALPEGILVLVCLRLSDSAGGNNNNNKINK